MADEVVIGVRTEGTEDASSSIVGVTASMDLLNEKIKAIRDSGASIDEQTAKLTALRDETKVAADAFAAMGKGGADSAAQFGAAVARLNAELGTTGAAGTAAVDGVAQKLATADAAAARFADTIDKGNPRMLQAFNRLILTQTALRLEIEKTFGAIENAPADVQAHYQQLGDKIAVAAEKTRQLRFQLQEQNKELAAAGYRFTTVGQAIEDTLGKQNVAYAEAGAGLGALGLALDAGWKIGMKFNEVMGADMTSWTESVNQIKDETQPVFAEMLKQLGSYINYLDALTHGNIPAAVNAWKEMRDSVILQNYAWDNGTRGLTGLGVALASTTDRAGVQKLTLQELLVIEDLHNKSLASGTLGLNIWKLAVGDGSKTAQQLLADIRKLAPAIDDMKNAVDAETASLVESNRELKKRIDGIKSHIDSIDALILKLKDEGDTAGTVAGAIEHMQTARLALIATLNKFQPAIEGSTKALDMEYTSLARLTGGYENNRPVIDAYIKQIKGEVDGMTNLTDAQRRHALSVVADATALDALAKQQETAQKTLADLLKNGFDQMTADEAEKAREAESELTRIEMAKDAMKDKVDSDAKAFAAGVVARKAALDKQWVDQQNFKTLIDGDMAQQGEQVTTFVDTVTTEADRLRADAIAAAGDMKAALVPLFADMSSDYKEATIAATIHAEAVKRVGESWKNNAAELEKYHVSLDRLPGGGKKSGSAAAP